jgi:transposase-like protein
VSTLASLTRRVSNGQRMAATPRRSSGRRLTPDEKERIVEMRLRGTPVREVAAAIPTTTRTVVSTFKEWCVERAAEFADEVEGTRAATIARLERIADDARRAYEVAERDGDKARFLAEERQALSTLAKLAGFEAPAKVEHSGDLGFSVLRIIEEVDQ